MNRISINVPGGHVRRLQDPTDEGRFSYHAYVRVRDLPTDLPLDVNPRKQNLKSLVSQKIKGGLENDPQVFHLLNRGLTIIAQSASYNNHNGILTLEFPEEEFDPNQDDNWENGDKKPDDPYDMDGYVRGKSYGIVDGGHTYKVLLQAVEELKKARTQNRDILTDPHVHLEVLVGVEKRAIDLARARNTSAQVTEQTLDNLQGRFKWLESLWKGKRFADKIAYVQFEDKRKNPIDIREIIQVLTAFHPDYLSRERPPIFAYTSAGRCLKCTGTKIIRPYHQRAFENWNR